MRRLIHTQLDFILGMGAVTLGFGSKKDPIKMSKARLSRTSDRLCVSYYQTHKPEVGGSSPPLDTTYSSQILILSNFQTTQL